LNGYSCLSFQSCSLKKKMSVFALWTGITLTDRERWGVSCFPPRGTKGRNAVSVDSAGAKAIESLNWSLQAYPHLVFERLKWVGLPPS
jgi:hypothetical protein